MSLFLRLCNRAKTCLFRRWNPPTKTTQTRNKSIFAFFKKPTAQKFKLEDNIPDEYSLIYRNTMNRYLLGAQLFSTVCAGVVCAIVIANSDRGYELKTDFFRKETKAVENEVYVYMIAFVGLCVALQLMVVKMPLRIYNYPKQKDYIFVTYGNMPFTKTRLTCKVKEVEKLEQTGILPWKDSVYKIKSKNVILVENFFRTPADLGILLGYQKGEEDD